MAIHKKLSIYKAGYELLNLATELSKNLPRHFKASIGGKIRDECVEVMVLIFRANCARNKAPHIDDLIEHVQIAELLFRLSHDKRFFSHEQYAKLIELTDSIGRQASGWKKYAASSPAS
ncbi:MAG: four helix bundle protein [Pseudomonadota bacterium]